MSAPHTQCQPGSEHTPTPWALMRYWPTKIVSASEVEKGIGASIHEDEDRRDFAVIIASAESNESSGYAHEIPSAVQRANAAFIVEAVNSHAALQARVEELTKALEFYADQRRHWGPNQRPIPDDPYAKPDAAYIMDVTRDSGSIARKALAMSLEDRK